MTAEVGELWTQEELAKLWKAPGTTAAARRKWVQRKVRRWGVPSCGSARDPRYLPAEVLRITERRLKR